MQGGPLLLVLLKMCHALSHVDLTRREIKYLRTYLKNNLSNMHKLYQIDALLFN
jgi:5-bromo-4-chloroindolyl phosphate hydrolysis protein